jgi:flagellar assembly protein FliH
MQALESRIRELEREMEVREKAAYRKGQEEAQIQLKRQTDEIHSSLRASIEELNARKKGILQDAEVSLVQLALAIARRVLHRELTISQDALSGLVRVALDRIRSQELLRVLVHPSQESQIRNALSALANTGGVEIVPSEGLAPGGLKFETRQGYLDLSVENQLSEIERGLTDHLKRLR